MAEFGAVVLVAVLVVLVAGLFLKLCAGLFHILGAIFWLPFQVLGAALALVGGVLLLPLTLLAALLVVLVLVGGLVVVPLLPFVLLGALAIGLVRWLRPRRT